MALFQGCFFLLIGVGLLVVVWRSLGKGHLCCGSNGLKGRLVFHRKEQPLLFWLMFVLYTLAGLWLTIFALRLLAGDAVPLPLA